jgi:PAS domain S-box-containing protein
VVDAAALVTFFVAMRESEIGPPARNGQNAEGMRAEQRLSESEMAFRELFELAPDAVVMAGADYMVTDANSATCKLYGYSREELCAKTLGDFLGPEEASRFVREIPLVPGLIHRGEWRVKRKDGSFVPVEISLKVLADGRQLAFIRDITERKRAERERDRSLRFVRAVLEQSPVGMILTLGARLEEVELNERAQQILGSTSETYEELRAGIRMPDGQPPRDPRELPLARALRGQRTVGAEFLARNAAGGFTPIVVNCAPIFSEEGVLLGAVSAFMDITSAKELERLRAEWSSVVAHDLRQPLGAISMSAQMLARATDDTKLLKHVDRIRAAANRLNRMVGDLMDLSRLEASRLELARQSVDLPAIVRAAAERAELETSDRVFDVRVEGEVPEVDADPDRIAQVLENLLSNAVKYGKAGTPIVMSVARDGGDVAVAVTNEGRGLTSEELAHIFERFKRTASAKLEGIQGTGLGLYITRALVEAHGGRVAAESTPAGVTTFRFTLPVSGSA